MTKWKGSMLIQKKKFKRGEQGGFYIPKDILPFQPCLPLVEEA